jgi:F0F1-type ATP synthase membrane subunit a
MLHDGTWHLMKWAWLAILMVYLVVQVVAIWRSSGEKKRRAQSVLIIMAVVQLIQSWIDGAFENRNASQISMLFVGIFAIAATIYLVPLLQVSEELNHPSDDEARWKVS